MITFGNLDPFPRRLEVGSTWLGRAAQRHQRGRKAPSPGVAVELRAHLHNRQSREAIARLGAEQDGVLRKHALFENGTVRDTVVFSIIDDEWPAVRFGLRARLGFRKSSPQLDRTIASAAGGTRRHSSADDHHVDRSSISGLRSLWQCASVHLQAHGAQSTRT